MALLKRFATRDLWMSAAAVAVVLAASWMGYASGGYFVRDWALVALALAVLMVVLSATGALGGFRSGWTAVALGFFAAYAAWTFASLSWSPNRGDAWTGVAQTLLYLMAFWITAGLVARGASRHGILAASALGPAVVAALTLPALVPRVGDLFENDRLIGTVGYYNGEAAFLLIPFWVGIYVAGSRDFHPVVRGLSLAGAALGAELAILTQSRGGAAALAVSLPVFFLLSGRRLRGLLALAPVAVALFVVFPGLNDVYLEFVSGGSPAAALERVSPTIWATAAGCGLYGASWGLVDRRWRPPAGVTRAAGGVALACTIAVLAVGMVIASERVGDPVAWGEQKWEAFKSNDRTGQEQSRYLSASGTGRYTLWQVAVRDFAAHPLLGVGTLNYEATYYQQRERQAGFVRQPHALVLEELAERGIVGGVLLLGFAGTCVAAGLHNRFTRLNAEGKAQVGALVAAVTYWFVHSNVEWFWQLPAVTLPAMVYLAVLAAPCDGADDDHPSPSWPLRAVVAGVAVLAAVVVAPLYVADRYLAHSYATEDPRAALESVERAQDFNPVNPILAQREAELAMNIGDRPRVESAYGRAIRLNPEHYAPYTLLAKSYEQEGRPDEALPMYRRALALNPLDRELKERVRQLEREQP